MELLKKKYTPENLPVHLIVPSLIGYGYSSAPPLDRDFATRDNATLFNLLMEGLGLKNYIAQGGDIGSFVSRFMASSDSCKGIVRSSLTNPAQSLTRDSDSFELLDLETWREGAGQVAIR